MIHKTKRVLLVENPNAGASDKQALLKELREDLLSQGFLVEQESKTREYSEVFTCRQ
jgi:hypothetical protein